MERGRIRLPAGYAVPKGDVEMMEFVSNWIDLKRKDGTIDGLYDYWMLGGAAKDEEAALVDYSRRAGLGRIDCMCVVNAGKVRDYS